MYVKMASFSRNFKRLAGPGFHVNVRYDDAHARLARTGSGGVDIQNRGFNKTHSAELLDVKEGELLLAYKRSHTRDGYGRCFSSLNGFPVPNADGNDDFEKLLERVYNDCVFMGVATTDFRSDDPAYNDQGFVAQVAGVLTLKHEGPQALHPGDFVSYAVAAKQPRMIRKGIPPFKERLVLVKCPKVALTVQDAVLKSRCIGKCMSYAKCGDSVDILLMPRSNY